MEFKVHKKLGEVIKGDQRDIALITAPGMGLSTLLNDLPKSQDIPVAFIDSNRLLAIWNDEYKNRSKNKRFVIHAATIESLIQYEIVTTDIPNISDIFRTNLKKFLSEFASSNGTNILDRFFVVIDDFDELPDDLEKIVLDELKTLSNSRENTLGYEMFNAMRFIIGGCIDFQSLYLEHITGVSPATQFCKHYPEEFLLSRSETESFIRQEYSELIKLPYALDLIFYWSNGYLFYVEELAKWFSSEFFDDPKMKLEMMVAKFKHMIEEDDLLPVESYCRKAWEEFKDDKSTLDVLYTAIKSGVVVDHTGQARRLMKAGLLLETRSHAQKNVFVIPNFVVEMYLRQRLAELGRLLPLSEIMFFGRNGNNIRAYELLLNIENRIRNFIGDNFFEKEKANWKKLLDVTLDTNESILSKVEDRQETESDSIFAPPGVNDPLVSYLDFGDLATLIEKNKAIFPPKFASQMPDFLRELNFYRRRVAHSRPITNDQINTVENRWEAMKKLMMK